ncbi:MAG TPA: hypothetical protein VEK06_04180 [Myxococcota bacterium]|nr:hypothetical protein [Myxococcota bacterium]
MRRVALFVFIFVMGLNVLAMRASTVNAIRSSFNLPDIKFKIKNNDITEQTNNYPSVVSFTDAAIKAMESFVTDASDDESPLRFSIGEVGEKLARINLNHLMNQETTTFGLVTEAMSDDPILFPAQREEISNNWIFYLKISEYDATFWAVVDREGLTKTYNYGAN